jgi:hypothetical protein
MTTQVKNASPYLRPTRSPSPTPCTADCTIYADRVIPAFRTSRSIASI